MNGIDMNEIRQVKEISSGLTERDGMYADRNVSEYIKNGWLLLAVHQRSFRDKPYTVYIMGRPQGISYERE